jgi:hypothetical protein
LAATHHSRCLTIALTLVALAAAGCSSSVVDSVPQWAGGMPENAPARPASVSDYPPVNDRPPPRDSRVVTVEEQAKIERDLAAARDVQARQAAQLKKERANMLANQPKPAAPPAN